MSTPETLHLDVAGYALGTLSPDERARFEAHLRDCDACRAELEELAPVAALAGAAGPLPTPPAGLGVRTLLAVERAAATAEATPPAAPTAPARRSRPRWLQLAVPATALAAILLAVLLARQPAGDEAPGRLEAVAALEAPGGDRASVEIFFTDIGRVVALDTDDLPILPKGEFYELWFVGPDDRPGAPDRISAGTFHPDTEGRSRVSLTAAVDPARYPRLAVTAEPGDGDPAPAGRDVLRGPIRPR